MLPTYSQAQSSLEETPENFFAEFKTNLVKQIQCPQLRQCFDSALNLNHNIVEFLQKLYENPIDEVAHLLMQLTKFIHFDIKHDTCHPSAFDVLSLDRLFKIFEDRVFLLYSLEHPIELLTNLTSLKLGYLNTAKAYGFLIGYVLQEYLHVTHDEPAVTQEFVDYINSIQTSWTAKLNPRVENLTRKQLNGLVGKTPKKNASHLSQSKKKYVPQVSPTTEEQPADEALEAVQAANKSPAKNKSQPKPTSKPQPSTKAQKTGKTATKTPAPTKSTGKTQPTKPQPTPTSQPHPTAHPTTNPSGPVKGFPKNFRVGENWPGCESKIFKQEKCDGCWAFSAVGVLSDRFCITTRGKIKRDLSAQYLIDCDYKASNCAGGSMDAAWWFLGLAGVPTDDCIPFQSADGKFRACRSHALCRNGLAHDNYMALPDKVVYMKTKDEIKTELMKNGSVQSAHEIYQDFMVYSSGIYVAKITKPLGGHAIRIVGWGESNGVEYWVIANSFGTDWGMKGYIHFKMGQLGIEEKAIAGFPNLAESPKN